MQVKYRAIVGGIRRPLLNNKARELFNKDNRRKPAYLRHREEKRTARRCAAPTENKQSEGLPERKEGNMNITGSLQQNKGYWYAMIRIPTENGKKKQKSISLHMKVGEVKKADAQRACDDVIYQARHDMISFDKDSFVRYVDKWLVHKEVSLSRSSWLRYKRYANKYIIPFYNDRGAILQEMKTQDIQDFVDFLRKERKLSPNTIRAYIVIVKGTLDWAVKNELIQKNPVKNAEIPPEVRSTIGHALTPEEFQRLLIECKGKTIYTPVFLAAHLGLRCSEIAGLCWDCVDFDAKIIHIRRKRVSVEGEIIFDDHMKTEKSRRDLPMSDAVGNFLRELQRQQRLDKIKHGRQYVNTDFVCRQEDGEGCVGNSIDVAFARAVERAGIPKCRLHDLRHTAATLALKNGANLKEVQEFLGHSNISTTANIYAHVDMEQKKSIADGLAATLAC